MITLQNLHEDLLHHIPVNEALEKVTKELANFVAPGPEREQIEQELGEVTTRFDRLLKMSTDRKRHIEEIEPLAKEHFDVIKPVEELNDEVEKALKEKSATVIDLDTLEDELARLKVGAKGFDPILSESFLQTSLSW